MLQNNFFTNLQAKDTTIQVLEIVKGEVERRFDQVDFSIIQKLKSLLLDVANGKPSTKLYKQRALCITTVDGC